MVTVNLNGMWQMKRFQFQMVAYLRKHYETLSGGGKFSLT